MSIGNWQDTAYIVMWKSKKSGGTFCELRRTDWGRDRLLRTLLHLGVPQENIRVERQSKPFTPDRLSNPRRRKGNDK